MLVYLLFAVPCRTERDVIQNYLRMNNRAIREIDKFTLSWEGNFPPKRLSFVIYI